MSKHMFRRKFIIRFHNGLNFRTKSCPEKSDIKRGFPPPFMALGNPLDFWLLFQYLHLFLYLFKPFKITLVICLTGSFHCNLILIRLNIINKGFPHIPELFGFPDFPEEVFTVFVKRIFKVFHKCTGVRMHNQNPVTQQQGFIYVMSDKEEAFFCFLPDRIYMGLHFLPGQGVQCAERFV